MPLQLTRDDLKGMTPGEIDKAREEGALDSLLGRDPKNEKPPADENGGPGENPDDTEEQTKKPSRRSQLTRVKMAGLDEEEMTAALADGSLHDIMETAKFVLDLDPDQFTFYEITGWDKEGQEFPTPIIKASAPDGSDREDLAEKLMSGPWVAFDDSIMTKAVDALDDAHVKASVWNLPLKPAQFDSIKNGEMAIVDPETGDTIARFETKDEKKQDEKKDAKAQERQDQARRIAKVGGPGASGF